MFPWSWWSLWFSRPCGGRKEWCEVVSFKRQTSEQCWSQFLSPSHLCPAWAPTAVCLSVSLTPLPITHTTCMIFFLPTMHICGVDSCVCTWKSSQSGRASQWGPIGWVRCYNLECLLVKWSVGLAFILICLPMVLCKHPGILLMDPLGTQGRGQK